MNEEELAIELVKIAKLMLKPYERDFFDKVYAVFDRTVIAKDAPKVKPGLGKHLSTHYKKLDLEDAEEVSGIYKKFFDFYALLKDPKKLIDEFTKYAIGKGWSRKRLENLAGSAIRKTKLWKGINKPKDLFSSRYKFKSELLTAKANIANAGESIIAIMRKAQDDIIERDVVDKIRRRVNKATDELDKIIEDLTNRLTQ